MGEYYKDKDRAFSESAKKIEKVGSIKQSYSSYSSFFALSDSKGILGWGDNSKGQVLSTTSKQYITQPQPLRLTLNSSDNTHIVSGSNTTFLLTSQRAEMQEVDSKDKSEVKRSAFCGTEESIFVVM